MKICFLFGHGEASEGILGDILAAAEEHYLRYGIRSFYVGSRGNFDRLAARAILRLKERYGDISLTLLLSYHPGERPVLLPPGFDGSFYPPLHTVPRRYAISRANRYMVQQADSIICYVRHPGNSRELLDCAKARRGIYTDNLGEKDP